MRPAALSIAVLLGIATSGGAAQAHPTPTVSATVVIENARTVQVGGKHHHRFHRGPIPHRKALVRHHMRWHDGWHHRPVFVGKRIHRAPVVIVKPAPARSFGYRHMPPRPLIKHGSFARGPYRW
jgi:hypothetical protein